jgi:hypothetical protein
MIGSADAGAAAPKVATASETMSVAANAAVPRRWVAVILLVVDMSSSFESGLVRDELLSSP